jgi:hypothetical protein
MGDRKEREKSIDQFMGERADTESLLYKGGDLGAQIAGTAGAPSLLAKGAAAIPALAKFAPAIQSSGFNLGPANTGKALADGLTRAGAGAVSGAAQTAMVNPEEILTGAGISAVTPSAFQVAGKAGNYLSNKGRGMAESLMMSSLKPTLSQHESGAARNAVATLLDEGISPNAAGVDKMRGTISGINTKVDNLIDNSSAQVNKLDVAKALLATRDKFGKQVAPQTDLAAINSVKDEFMANPTAPHMTIPVRLAQELKKGTYRVLEGKYGEVGSASTEAQKALARGLKDEVAKAVPEISALNAREGRLLDTLDVVERRLLMDMNKNPGGLTLLAGNKAAAAAFLADRSAAFKSLAARMINQASRGVGAAKALENFQPNNGLLGAPALLATSP